MGEVDLEWEGPEGVETPGFWANKSPKLFRCLFCNCGARDLDAPQSTMKELSRLCMGCWGMEKRGLVQTLVC